MGGRLYVAWGNVSRFHDEPRLVEGTKDLT